MVPNMILKSDAYRKKSAQIWHLFSIRLLIDLKPSRPEQPRFPAEKASCCKNLIFFLRLPVYAKAHPKAKVLKHVGKNLLGQSKSEWLRNQDAGASAHAKAERKRVSRLHESAEFEKALGQMRKDGGRNFFVRTFSVVRF